MRGLAFPCMGLSRGSAERLETSVEQVRGRVCSPVDQMIPCDSRRLGGTMVLDVRQFTKGASDWPKAGVEMNALQSILLCRRAARP